LFQITKTIGVDGVLSVSLLSYILRLVIYAAIRSPWEALPAEIVRGLTFGTFWSSSTYYVYSTSPKGLTATMVTMDNLHLSLSLLQLPLLQSPVPHRTFFLLFSYRY